MSEIVDPSAEAMNAAQQCVGAQPRALIIAFAAAFDAFAALARDQALEQAAEIAEWQWQSLACPEHYSGQVGRHVCRMSAEAIRAQKVCKL
jgi:hypothetical protein